MKRNKLLIGVLTFSFVLIGVLWYYDQSHSRNQLQKTKEIDHVYMYYNKDVFNSNNDIYEILDEDYIKSLQRIFDNDLKKLSSKAEHYGLAPWVNIEFQYIDGTSDAFFVFLDNIDGSVGYYHIKNRKTPLRYKLTPDEFVNILHFPSYRIRDISILKGN